MKANKVLLILQVIGMYIMHLPLYAILILFNLNMDQDLQANIIKILFILFFVLSAVILPICLLITVFSIISIFKGEYNPSKVVMISKLALIPWYIMNFVICFILLAGMLNPFLMVAIPVLFVIMIFTTYIYMLATSLPDIANFINGLIKRKIRVKASLIVSIVFLFIFCLDIIGGIIYHINVKTAINE